MLSDGLLFSTIFLPPISVCGCRFPFWHYLLACARGLLVEYCRPLLPLWRLPSGAADIWPQLLHPSARCCFTPSSQSSALPEFRRRFTQILQFSSLPALFFCFTFSLQFAPLPNFSFFFSQSLQSTFTPSPLRLYTSITNFCAGYRVFLYTKITKLFAFFLFFLYLNFTLRSSLFRPSIISNLIEIVKLIVCKVALLISRPLTKTLQNISAIFTHKALEIRFLFFHPLFLLLAYLNTNYIGSKRFDNTYKMWYVISM